MAIFRDYETGEVFERDMNFSELQEANTLGTEYELDGRRCTRLVKEEVKDDENWRTEKKGIATQGYSFNHGRAYSAESLGVSPHQAEEFENHLRMHGCLNEVDRRTGAVEINSEAEWLKVAKARGMGTGKDGFYIESDLGVQDLTGKAQAQQRDKIKAQIEESVKRGQALPPELTKAFEGM